jgi:predicted transcriptional regulator/plasmid maintenance system antidote protein VapI
MNSDALLSNVADLSERSVGAGLREIRLSVGLTQRELATRLGVSQAALSRIENERDMLISTIRDYLIAAGASWEFTASLQSRLWSLTRRVSSEGGRKNEMTPGTSRATPPRDIVFSIKPKYAHQILEGSKTVELRRRFPANVAAGSNALIYVTSPTRAMTGVATIARVVRDCPKRIWRNFAGQTGVPKSEYNSYFLGSDFAYAIFLERARPLIRSVRLEELRDRFAFEPPQSFLYAKADLREALVSDFAAISD